MGIHKRIIGIQWAVGGGFFLIAAFSWIGELLESFGWKNGTTSTFDWSHPITENFVVLIVAVPGMILLRGLLSRIDYLEGFLSVCAWCRKVDHNGDWVTIDEFFARKFQTETSHGICGPCSDKMKADLAKRVERPA